MQGTIYIPTSDDLYLDSNKVWRWKTFLTPVHPYDCQTLLPKGVKISESKQFKAYETEMI